MSKIVLHSLQSIAIFLAALGVLPFFVTQSIAQTTEMCLGRVITPMDFSANPVLVSGTALQPGAVYRYSNVSFGIDALVRIVSLNNGASLSTIDNNGTLRAFFNPELGGTNARSVDFQFTFVISGTNTPTPIDFAAGAIDVDGDSGSLREYAEFESNFSEYVLNSPTNLSVNSSTPSTGNTRFEPNTNFTAPGIDPTAFQNIVATFYTRTSSFRYRIGTLGTGSSVRLTSLQFTCPNVPSPVRYPVTQDFGDAPNTYGNPRHDVFDTVRLGATNTRDAAGYNSPDASADPGDDGVTFPTLRRNNAASLSISVTGGGGLLQAWFDWNADGDFLDAGEQVALNVGDNGPGDTNSTIGIIGLNVAVPQTAALGNTFARFRWSTQRDVDAATMSARDGEVEDYRVTVLGTPVLTTTKTSVVYTNTSPNGFHTPGNDVLYTITTSNTGSASTDSGSVVVIDSLPPQVELFVGDFDGAGPATGTVLFTQSNGAALTFAPSTDLRFSNTVAAPSNFAACSYSPPVTNTYDPAIRHVCINPKQGLAANTPAPSFSIQFRARIR
jgi:hypothetical protein